MTRFLANEKMPAASIDRLRSHGLDVVWVRETAPGSNDPSILDWAVRTDRIILTFDHDYGDLVFRHGVSALGVVLFRFKHLEDLEEPGNLILALLDRPGFRFDGLFVVIARNSVRFVPLPRDARSNHE